MPVVPVLVGTYLRHALGALVEILSEKVMEVEAEPFDISYAKATY